jgi:HSP20 family protein
VLASAAISALVLPLRVGDRIATDGGWVRNFPLGYAYGNDAVETIVAFRYLPRYPRMGTAPIEYLRRRLERFGRVPPIRALLGELRDAEARAERGEPAHLVEMIARLMRVSILRNSVLEERIADATDASIRELEALRREIDQAFSEAGLRPPGRRRQHAFLPGRAARQYPLVNIYDDGTNYYVEALAPGIDSEQVEIHAVSRGLTISGEKLGLQEVAPERVHRSERATGRFSRTVELPHEIDPDQVSAEYRDGLLLLTVPRAEAARPRRVTIKAS